MTFLDEKKNKFRVILSASTNQKSALKYKSHLIVQLNLFKRQHKRVHSKLN